MNNISNYSNDSDSILVSNNTERQAEGIMESRRSETTTITVVAMLSVFSVVGVIGNAIAFYIYFRRRTTSTSVIFILALAGTDFITCLVTIPYTIVFELLEYRLVYDLACKAYMFLITSTVPFSAYIMVGIALDRYFCICHPFLYLFTIPRARAVIFVLGIPALVFGIITALSYGTFTFDSQFMDEETLQQWANHSNVSGPAAVARQYMHPGDTLLEVYTMSGGQGEVAHYPNTTNVTVFKIMSHYGVCHTNNFVFSPQFLAVYKRVHAAGFLVAYITVAVLYILIYKSIFTRRANKVRRKKNNLYPTSETKHNTQHAEETQMSVINGGKGSPPKVLNNQTARKDGHARKIMLTERNDPSAAAHKAAALAEPYANLTPKDESTYLLSQNEASQPSGCKDTSTEENNENTGKLFIESLHPEDEVDSNNRSDCKETSQECHISPMSQKRSGNNSGDESDMGNDNDTTVTRVVPDPEQDMSNPAMFPEEAESLIIFSPEKEESEFIAADDATSDMPLLPVSQPASATPTASSSQNAPDLGKILPSTSPAVPPTSLAVKPHFQNESPCGQSAHKTPTSKHVGAGKHRQTDAQTNSIKRKRPSTVRDRNLMANIKTAFMLFIVTLVFGIAFLPALLMANRLIELNLIVFNSYFVYNVANPFIYAFMNQTFREDLKKIINVCGR